VRFGTLSERLVLVREHAALDVNQASEGRFPADVKTALERWEELRAWAGQADWSAARPLDEAALGPPVPLPRQVFAVALNYRPHAVEAGFSPPSEPLIFTKFPSCITGPYGTIALPDGHVDWEIELVAVIGTGGRDIARANAWDAIAGVTIGQDLSERKLQLTGTPPQFSLAKSFARFGPTGPVAVATDELADRDDIGFECWLNNERVQRGRTSEMIFPVDDLVARMSRVCRLLPGDLIFTGTPAGVGNRRNPPRYLAEGDVLVSRFEGIGEIRQSFAR
jgi:2-keto-4-pentenoate hydratase/2-oxohepta-3-ene-1,7-dioic acid hydratase in catechol pathway